MITSTIKEDENELYTKNEEINKRFEVSEAEILEKQRQAAEDVAQCKTADR